MTLKLVLLREEVDFKAYPVHQLGFVVADIDRVISLTAKYGGKQEGQTMRHDGKAQAVIRDPDGNTIEQYSMP